MAPLAAGAGVWTVELTAREVLLFVLGALVGMGIMWLGLVFSLLHEQRPGNDPP